MVKSRKAHQPWNEDRDWSTFYQQLVGHGEAMQIFQYEQQALWTFIISHVSKEVLHHIKLDVTYSDIYCNKDTYALLMKSTVTKGTNNLQNLRNEWKNFKQYTLDGDSHLVSLNPLRVYQQISGISLTNSLEPTEIEKANTLLAGVDSVQFSSRNI